MADERAGAWNPAGERERVAKRAWQVAAGALVAALAVAVFSVRASRTMPDFAVYRVAGARALAAEPLYRVEDGHWLFKYLPAYALVMAPFALAPDRVARALWFALNVAVLAVVVRESWRLLPGRRRRVGVLVAVALVALGKFYARELTLGQSNLLLALAVLFAVGQWRAGHAGAAGAWLAVATLVKPYAIIMAPWLVARRQWRAAGAMAAGLAVILVVPAVRYGMAGNVALLAGWWETVTTSTAPNLVAQDNISVAGLWAKSIAPGPLAAGLAAVTGALVALGTASVLWRRPVGVELPEYLDSAVLLVLIPLLSPQGWDYVLVVATPAVMLLADRLGALPSLGRVAVVACVALLGLTLYDVVGRASYRAFMMSPVPTVAVLVEVGLLLHLRLRRLA